VHRTCQQFVVHVSTCIQALGSILVPAAVCQCCHRCCCCC
jgi:hypothetical protein